MNLGGTVSIPRRRARWTCGASTVLLSAIFLVGIARGAEETTDDPMRWIVARHETSKREIWYEPALDYVMSYDFKAYPAIGEGDDGRKWLVLRAVRKSRKGIGVKSLEFRVDGTTTTLPLERRDVDTDRNGCRVAERISVSGQESLIRSIATAKEVNVTVTGSASTDQYRLADEDLDDFRRLLAVYDMPEKPHGVSAGDTGVTNPEVIRSTRVLPDFPRQARQKVVRGKVTLRAVVRKDGSVGDVQVVRSTACDCGFEAAAMSALMQWRYKPGTANGQPVDVYFTVDIDFAY